ncbi:hypothetical protein AMAG_19352 [Allomyces macrogynus ATCC 38327]|uniref:Uncharacterized protein n=1 Tax=Allomyces macrogynus (strain ATCC 38327) TaxID=578462 RepID=A0A0L0SUB2_ALLM3|nr:hypothetical protein AMAG_19352 [Allomyces macrogynus ATCC 38327]|eukprot:KNE66163.1 hypothetical protein AMAG_19352 [Allomyces macrogynus ATCC 38327]
MKKIPGIPDLPRCQTLGPQGKLVFMNLDMQRRFLAHLPQLTDLIMRGSGPVTMAGIAGYGPPELEI